MSLATLLTRLAAGEDLQEIRRSSKIVPPVPPCSGSGGTLEPAPALTVPPVPPQNNNVPSKFVSLADFRQIPVPPAPTLSQVDEQKIRQWLRDSGETACAIESDLEVFRRRLDSRQWILRIIEEQAESVREATEERAAILEFDGGLCRQEAERIAQLSRAFYDHLMGPGVALHCCHAPHNRYCAEGLKLRDTYYEAAKAAGRLI
ncbi:MAG: hypothetical protein ACYDBH_18645 [Acidobacteriaceae bacterium]